MFMRSIERIETEFEISLNVVRHFSWINRWRDKLIDKWLNSFENRYADWIVDADCCEELMTRYSDVDWLDCSDAIDADCCKVIEYCKAIRVVIVRQNWILHRSCSVYRSFESNASQRLDIALQLNAAHVNKTAIEAVNRYSMMLSFVTIKREN